MSEKKNGNSGGFLTKTGMTVIVLLLVCVIGMSYSIFKAYRTMRNIDTVSFDKDAWEESVSETEQSLPSAPPAIQESEPEAEELAEDYAEDDYVAAEVYEPEEGAEELPADVRAIPVFNGSDTGLSMILPLSGRIICDYSSEELVYSETFDDWRVHLGIDIAAAEGTPVTAAASGVAEKVYTDESLGLTAVIRHTSYISTLYAGLSACDISAGAVITQGETIGLSGSTAAFESASEPHLHFEVLRDGTPADPYEYLTLEE